jgi:hypothetical protein
LSEFFTVMDLKKYFWASLFLAIICLAGAVLAVMSSGDASMLRTDVRGFGDIDIREQVFEGAPRVAAMGSGASILYASAVEWGEIVVFRNSFEIFGAPAITKKWLGHRNQYVIQGTGGGNAMEYRATAVEGDFVGEADLILRGEGYPDKDGNILEARIKLDSSQGKSVLDLMVINRTTGKPATAFELKGVGNFTFQQYLLLNISQREALTEEDFCESLDRILPRDFSGVYIAPHGKKLTPDADLVADDATVEPVEVSTSIGRFAEEQKMMDEYRAAHPEEFEEEEEPDV